VGLLLILVLTACSAGSPSPTPSSPSRMSSSWVLAVDLPGPVWLAPDWLQTSGVDASLVPDEVRLSQGEHQVPYLVLERPEGPGILFFATEAPTRYASWTSYRLDVGQGPGELIQAADLPNPAYSESDSESASGTAQNSTWTVNWHELDLQYRPQIPVAEPWFWEPIYSQTRITHTLLLTEAISGPITLTVRLASRGPVVGTDLPPTVWWDGEQVGEWGWDGPEAQSWPVELIHSDGSRGHLLTVELLGQPDAPASRVWLDGYGATFRQPLALTEPELWWTAEADEAVVAGIEGVHLLDVTDLAAPLHLGIVEGERIPSVAGHHYWAGSPWLAPTPKESRPLTTIDREALKAAEYLTVAPEPFWRALEPLMKLRQDQGLNVSLITPSQVYDAYGDGRPDPVAIRSMVRQLHKGGRLRYLLLVGDASSRPDGYAGEYDEPLVVTDLVPTIHLHETPSDETMVVDEQGRPLVAVGRFPAQTAADVEAMVQKTLRWDTRRASPALILHDDQPDFARFVDQVWLLLPASTQQLDMAQENARSAVLQQLGKEGTWLNYVGHGSLALWGDEKVLRREDEWRESAVVTAWACLSGYFVHPEEDSLAEVWLRSPRGGAVAFLGPTGETYLFQQEPLARTFYQEIQAGRTLGEALLAAWQNSGDGALDAVRSYLLLGDPALRLYPPEPE
jgi:hypothetical protein